MRRKSNGLWLRWATVEVVVFEPTEKYQNVAKPTGVQTLTPARALVAEMVRRYWVVGHRMHLPRSSEALLVPGTYGSPDWALPNPLQASVHRRQVRSLLGPSAASAERSWTAATLHCDKRLSDAGPSDTIWFDEGRRAFLELYLKQNEQRPLLPVLDRTAALIDGFESPLGMELLATVDWLIDSANSARPVCRRSGPAWRGGLRVKTLRNGSYSCSTTA